MFDFKEANTNAIKNSVREKLENQKGEIIMVKRRFKPLLITAAVIGTVFISMVTVNAATDGALKEKVSDVIGEFTVKINGKECKAQGEKIQDENGNTIYEFSVNDEQSWVTFEVQTQDEIQNESEELNDYLPAFEIQTQDEDSMLDDAQ